VSGKAIFLVALSAILIVVVFLLDPIAQDPAYYEFADNRTILALPHFWNVVSNVAFLLVGGTGLFYLRSKNRPGVHPDMHVAYIIFFAGVFLTGIGSAYFHYAPGNSTLVWDRLPMTIGFMALFAIIIGEYISLRVAKRMLIPLLIIGAASVVYWGVTEVRGAGDLRPYAVVQFLPILLIPLILLMYRSEYDKTGFLWIVVALYVLSKLFEQFDLAVFETGRLISGHSVKHIVAALAPLVFLYGLDIRRPENSGSLQVSLQSQ
jgi:hypothetical protein